MRLRLIILSLALPLIASAQNPPLQMEQSTTTASLRGIHAAGPGVAWASGTNGTVLRTEDAGFVWQSCAMPPGAGPENAKLDFRGIWAWDAMTAIVMSSGPGDQSRLYKTIDGCVTWKLLATNTEKDGFWDAIAFSDPDHGVLLGDPVHGSFVVLLTEDGGEHWKPFSSTPLAPAGSGVFAASNSALFLGVTSPARIVFGTGASGKAESTAGIYNRNNVGGWDYRSIPIAASSKASGIFSLAYRTRQMGVAVGGNFEKPGKTSGTAAWTKDDSRWTAATHPPHGYRSSVAWDADNHAWITAGPNGSDYSRDDGRTWVPLENGNWNAISLPYLVGPGGRIGKLVSLPEGVRAGPEAPRAEP